VASGDYDRAMKKLRNTLMCNRDRMIALVQQHFPENTCVSEPLGGAVLWIQLPKHCDTVELFYKALEHKISIAPGAIFSPTNKYKSCFRISFGLPWDETLERGVAKLGEIVRGMI
jgi:DNA-binding transcriptional MocR family regulator